MLQKNKKSDAINSIYNNKKETGYFHVKSKLQINITNSEKPLLHNSQFQKAK
jgi:hypothetical protein